MRRARVDDGRPDVDAVLLGLKRDRAAALGFLQPRDLSGQERADVRERRAERAIDHLIDVTRDHQQIAVLRGDLEADPDGRIGPA